VWYFVNWVFTKTSVPDVVRTIVIVLFALVVFLAALGILGYGPGAGRFR